MLKCLVLLFVLGLVDAQYSSYQGMSSMCPYPRLDHGRIRVRQRSRLVKFTCNFRYELVGNKYATCRNGQWDESLPVCVKSGCEPIPDLKRGLQMVSHHGAWVVMFCFPGHKLVGSQVVYCDGYNWNATAPTCVESTTQPKDKCDFEEPDLCGWTQDELHDFDWRRLNLKTPSSYLFTGPSYDHTLGSGEAGYYMYIESTSRLINETARLISPIYDASVVRDGCFLFYYHMYGKDTGGLRVYQKPESFPLTSLLNLTDTDKQKYMLFEQWGDYGDEWLPSVSDLRDFSDSFQIVIEGIRGKSFTSDIAIDDVAILHGENCTAAKMTVATTPSYVPMTCSGRCDQPGAKSGVMGKQGSCGCTIYCILDDDCCPDFIELCAYSFNGSKTDDDTTPLPSPTMEQPQTDKLIAITDQILTTTTTIAPKPTTKSTTTSKPSSTTTSTTTSTTRTTTSTTTTTTTPKPTTTKPIKTTKPTVTTRVYTTTKIPRTTLKSTKTSPKQTTITTSTTTRKSTSTSTTANLPYGVSRTLENHNTYHEMVQQKNKLEENKHVENHSSALRTAMITVVVLACCCLFAFVAVSLRTARGRLMIAQIRGRTTRDPEVRYLNADIED